MSDLAKTIGANIRSARESVEISQRGLAREIGVSSPTMTFWERGQHEPTASKLLEIAQVCGVSVLSLYGLKEDEGLYEAGRLAGWAQCEAAVTRALRDGRGEP